MRSFLLLVLSVVLGHATTYYIDYATGSDANNGTAKTTPWKHVPVMQDFSGAYTHVDGDRFIFKGGVTWGNAAVPLYITVGGAAGNYDYYGVDVTWFTGGSWTQPVLTGEAATFVNHTGNRENMIYIYGSASRYVTIDNLKITDWRVTNPVSNQTDCSGVQVHNSGDVLVTNCWIGDWEPASTGAAGGGVTGGYGVIGPIEVDNCTIVGPMTINPIYVTDDTPGYKGYYTAGHGVRGASHIEGCDISRTSQGIWGGSEIWNNVIHDVGASFQNGAHENGIRLHGDSNTRGNVVHDIFQGIGVYLIPGWGGDSPRRSWCYNNVFYNLPQVDVSGTETQTDQIPPNINESWFVNNVIVDTLTSMGVKSGSPTEGPSVRANNLFINDSGSLTSTSLLKSDGLQPGEINSNNVLITHAQATAVGMTEANNYKPTSSLAAIVGQGLNFSSNPLGTTSPSPLTFTTDFDGATRSAPWDVGAYQFTTAADVPGTLALASEVYSVGEEGGSITLTVTRNSGSTGIVGVSYATGDSSPVSAVAGSDYTAVSPPGTLSWANGETASKTFNVSITSDVATEGNETFIATISSPTGGASLGAITTATVTIIDNDTGPTIPLMDGLSFGAEAGLIESPFTISGGVTVSQSSATTDPTIGGRARYRVTIPSTGNYRIDMGVNASSTASDSAFIEWDAEPISPSEIWDVQTLTNGIQTRTVSWRGVGTFNGPEFAPKIWNLTSGEHTLYIRGREAGFVLDSITVVAESASDTTPPSPSPATWLLIPAAVSDGVIEMAATPATDTTGPVQYEFDETSGNPGGTDSGWQPASTYVDIGLIPGIEYTYRMRTRDGVGTPNVTSYSTTISAITDQLVAPPLGVKMRPRR